MRHSKLPEVWPELFYSAPQFLRTLFTSRIFRPRFLENDWQERYPQPLCVITGGIRDLESTMRNAEVVEWEDRSSLIERSATKLPTTVRSVSAVQRSKITKSYVFLCPERLSSRTVNNIISDGRKLAGSNVKCEGLKISFKRAMVAGAWEPECAEAWRASVSVVVGGLHYSYLYLIPFGSHTNQFHGIASDAAVSMCVGWN